jgi:GTPase SAR1 family protein
VVYDVTDRESYTAIESWLAEIEKHAAASVNKVLIGNKCDLVHERKVTKEEAAAFAKRQGMKYMETSAKTCANVQDAFKIMATEIQSRLSKGSTSTPSGTSSVAKGSSLVNKKDSKDTPKKKG